MSIPTIGEEYAKLLEYLIKAQEASAMLGHLHQMQDNSRDSTLGKAWLIIAEALRAMQIKVTQLAQGRLN